MLDAAKEQYKREVALEKAALLAMFNTAYERDPVRLRNTLEGLIAKSQLILSYIN
jgi:hypothetical protein